MNRLTLAFALTLATLTLAPRASAQGVLFSDGFENGFANWSATGLWHVIDQGSPCGMQVWPFPEGQFAAYFGVDNVCNFDTGAAESGALTMLTPIALPAGGPAARLHCWTRHQHEPCGEAGGYDSFNVLVSANGGSTWTLVGRSCYIKFGPPDEWEPRGIDLTSFLGQSILVRFTFDTIDNLFNDYRGAFVDKLELRLEAGKPFCTSTCPCAGPYAGFGLMGYGNKSGCSNSARREGELAGRGVPSVANDSVVLNATELVNNTVAILLQADTHSTGAFSGDGRACLTGTIARVAVRGVTNGAFSFPAAGDPPLSVAGSVPAGGATKHYQVLYRDNGAYCTSSQFNLTNGYTINWTP